MKEKDGKVKLKSLEERWASILLYIFMPIVRTNTSKIVLFLSFLWSKLTLLSDDMRRELIRKKWEQEVQEALDKPDGPIHYQDMFDGEG